MGEQFFMLVNKGLVQRHLATRGDQSVKVWPIAETHDDAARLATWLNAPHARPAVIGSVQGETLEGHVSMAIEEGCVACCCVAGWSADGSPTRKWMPFE